MAAVVLVQSRAVALRKALEESESLAKEANIVLEGYTHNLEALMESVERVAARAQALTAARRQIDAALKQADDLLEHLDTPRKVQARLKQGPKAGLEPFLAALSCLDDCTSSLARHRGIRTVDESLELAHDLCDEVLLLCYDEFQGNIKRYARLLPQAAAEQTDSHLSGAGSFYLDEALPSELLHKLRRLHQAMQCHGNRSCLKVYIDVRMSVMENLQLKFLGKRSALEDINKMSWPVVERHIQAWIAMNAEVAGQLVVEQSVAFQIFGEEDGQTAFLEVVKPWIAQASRSAAQFTDYRRVPEKAFGLIDMGERTAAYLPMYTSVLPTELICVWQELLASFLVEARATYQDFRMSLSSDPQRHTVGDGSVHPLAAQTIAFLKRLLTFRTAAAAMFDNTTSLTHEIFEARIQSPAQRQALRTGLEELLSTLWSALTAIALTCKNKALAALFLMNNAHYQLKSVQASSSLNAISEEWQDNTEDKVEKYGLQYQASSWTPILALMGAESQPSESKSTWLKEKHTIRERWRHINASVETLIEQQRTWSVPDVALRGNLRNIILEDFMPTYKAFWHKHEVLPFAKKAEKYLRVSPDDLAKVVNEELFEAQSVADSSLKTSSA